MKVIYHQVTPTPQESFRVLEFRGSKHNCTWHFHPEYQIGLVIKGGGHRIVGDNVGPLEAGEVSLLGPNLPHAWQFEAYPRHPSEEIHSVVVYFSEKCFGSEFFACPEMEAVRNLLRRAASGILALGRTRRDAARLLEALPAQTGGHRVVSLLQILNLLAESVELAPICTAGFVPHLPDAQSGERLRVICRLIQERLGETIHRDEIAAMAHFSPSTFSRFFKARTGKTFHDFVTELRIGRACRLLAEQELSVTEIALSCGYANAASFNRSFRRAKCANPTEFRRRMQAMN